MMITKKAINDDIAFIVATLKNKEVAIPSFLSCTAPGIAVLVGMPLWQFCIAYDMSTFKLTNRMGSLLSIGFSLFLGFLLFIVITSMRSKYLSLPAEIRNRSLIVRLIKHKALFYAGLWVSLNLAAGLLVKHLEIDAIFSYVAQFASTLILWFIVLLDLGRYDLAVFSSVIKAWRDGDKLDPEQLKGLDI